MEIPNLHLFCMSCFTPPFCQIKHIASIRLWLLPHLCQQFLHFLLVRLPRYSQIFPSKPITRKKSLIWRVWTQWCSLKTYIFLVCAKHFYEYATLRLTSPSISSTASIAAIDSANCSIFLTCPNVWDHLNTKVWLDVTQIFKLPDFFVFLFFLVLWGVSSQFYRGLFQLIKCLHLTSKYGIGLCNLTVVKYWRGQCPSRRRPAVQWVKKWRHQAAA
jgi:hypothetical protein